jgi:hypothetical protein
MWDTNVGDWRVGFAGVLRGGSCLGFHDPPGQGLADRARPRPVTAKPPTPDADTYRGSGAEAKATAVGSLKPLKVAAVIRKAS